MKVFRFSMQHVLEARLMQEERAQVELAEAERRERTERERAERLLSRLRAASCCLAGEESLITGRDVAARSRYRMSLEGLYRQQQECCEAAHQAVLTARSDLLKRVQSRRAIEVLRDQAKAEWLASLKRHEQQMMDEVAIQSNERKRQDQHDPKAA